MRLYWQRANNPDCLLLSQNQTRKFHAPLSKTPNFQQVFHTYWKKPTKEGSIAGEKRLKKQLLRWKREREMVWNSIRKGRLSRMTRLSIRVGGRQRISHASSFHFIPRASSGGLPPPLSREWRGLEWFQRGRQRNGRYSSILRRFPWKTMQTRGRIPSSALHATP